MQRHASELPDFILDELRKLPRYADRMALASAISRLIFPVSRRTLEAWPLRWRRVNGHAVAETYEAFAYAWRKFDSAPVATGRQRSASRPRTRLRDSRVTPHALAEQFSLASGRLDERQREWLRSHGIADADFEGVRTARVMFGDRFLEFEADADEEGCSASLVTIAKDEGDLCSDIVAFDPHGRFAAWLGREPSRTPDAPDRRSDSTPIPNRSSNERDAKAAVNESRPKDTACRAAVGRHLLASRVDPSGSKQSAKASPGADPSDRPQH